MFPIWFHKPHFTISSAATSLSFFTCLNLTFYLIVRHLRLADRTAGWQSTINECFPLQKSTDSHFCRTVTFHVFETPEEAPLQSPPPRSWRPEGHSTVMHSLCTDSTGVTAANTSLQTCWHITHTISKRCINHDNTTPSACVCYLCMHECNPGRIVAYWCPLLYWNWERRVLLLQHASPLPSPLRFRKVFVILWLSLYIVAWHRSKVV